MQVGDLVRFRQQPDPAVGVIVKIDNNRRPAGHVEILWSFLAGQTGWQRKEEIEVISANR